MPEVTLALVIGVYVIGLLMIVVEMFVPGGVLGTFGLLAVIAGIILGFQYSIPLGTMLLVAGVVLVPALIVTAMKYAPGLPFTGKLFLKESLDSSKGYSASEDGLMDLKGRAGTAVSNLRPSGIADIGGNRVDVVTGGEMIDRGTRIEVIEVEGNRVVVQEVENGKEF